MRSLVRYLKEFARAHLTPVRYPPGLLRPRAPPVQSDQRALIKLAARLGPVFKQWAGRHTTYIVGHKRARRFLAEHEDKISSISVDLAPIVPGGWIRQMRGETHRHYRRILLEALQATLLAEHEAAIRAAIAGALGAVAAHPGPPEALAAFIRQQLRAAARSVMIRLFLGVPADDPLFPELSRLYDRFGPEAPVARVESGNAEAYRTIRTLMLQRVAAMRERPPAMMSALRAMVERDAVDDTSLGHVIFMVEPGYFDVCSLWRWVMKILADNPATVAEIAPVIAGGGEAAQRMVDAVGKECLRLEQSEILFKRAHQQCAIDGMRVPANSEVRVCLWEGHKDAGVFPEPFAFRPQRFLEREYSLDEYAPFGLDKHRCLGSAIVLFVTAIFVEELFARRPWQVVGDGPPVYGIYHWEPNPAFAVRLATEANAITRPSARIDRDA